MGCLAELFLELVVELFGELIEKAYLKLMTLILPRVGPDPKTLKRLKNAVKAYSIILLLLTFVCGLIWAGEGADYPFGRVCKYITLICGGLILVQITAGLVYKIVTAHRRGN